MIYHYENKTYSFTERFGVWYIQSSDTIAVLEHGVLLINGIEKIKINTAITPTQILNHIKAYHLQKD